MIDIHTHVLPGIDDGADDLAAAVAMCRLAAADGCEALVATPHQRTPTWDNCDHQALEELFARLREEVGDTIELHLGAEVRVDSGLLAELAGDTGQGPLPLAGSRWLLLELDRHGLQIDPEDLVHELVVAGWRPIFAHPEFIPALAADLGRVGELAAAGAFFQITAMSLTGDFGRTPRQVCRELLDRGLVHFVASDAHGVEHRPTGLARAHRALAEHWGAETAILLTRDNPRAVLEDRPLPLAHQEVAAPRRLAL